MMKCKICERGAVKGMAMCGRCQEGYDQGRRDELNDILSLRDVLIFAAGEVHLKKDEEAGLAGVRAFCFQLRSGEHVIAAMYQRLSGDEGDEGAEGEIGEING